MKPPKRAKLCDLNKSKTSYEKIECSSSDNEDLTEEQNEEQKEEQMTEEQNKEQKTEDKDQPIIKLNQLIYQLEWSKRDELISILNEYSSFIYCKYISEDRKQELSRKNEIYYKLLVNLKCRSNSILNTRDQKRPVLRLDYDTKIAILQCLIDNQSFMISLDQCLSNKFESNLIERNNELINNLLNLPVEIVHKDTPNGPNIETGSQMFNIVFENINEFIKSDQNLFQRHSYSSIDWFIQLKKIKNTTGIEFLGIKLAFPSITDKYNKFQAIDTCCRVVLLEQPISFNRVSFVHNFDLKKSSTHEHKYLISIENLKNGSYIKENKIKFNVELDIKKIIFN